MKKFQITASTAPDQQTLFVDVLKNDQRFILTVQDNKDAPITAWSFRDALASLIEENADQFETELFYDISE